MTARIYFVCAAVLGAAVILILELTEHGTGSDLAEPTVAVEQTGPRGTPLLDESSGDRDAANRANLEAAEDRSGEVSSGEASVREEDTETVAESIRFHTDSALDGMIYINDVISQLENVAALPVEEKVDFSYESDDSIAYRLLGAPEGVSGHLLVGTQPHELDGKRFRSVGLDVTVDLNKNSVNRNCVRESSRINIEFSFEEDRPEAPARMQVLVQEPIALSDSVSLLGSNAYHGINTTGAVYAVDFIADPLVSHSGTFGIVEGNISSGSEFPGISPLAGDTQLAPERAEELLTLLREKTASLTGGRK